MPRAALIILLALAACERAPAASVPLPSTTTTSGVPPASVDTTVPPAGCLTGELPFVSESGPLPIALQDGDPDARHIAGWSMTSEPGCDRITVSLATEGGAPARVAGQVDAVLMPTEGILRVRLDAGIATTAVIDQRFEARFASSAFVVRSLEGPFFLDIHLGESAAARVFVDRSPAIITIDLARGSEPIGSPVTSDDTVIVSPTDPRQAYPLEVFGYVRGDSVSGVMTGEDGPDEPVVGEVAEGSPTWKEYRLVVPAGPTGIVILEINGPETTKLLELS